jgi:hypothetical protein
MRAVTTKFFQTHFQCMCGMNVVDHDNAQIKWKDLSKAGIVRRKDRSTGKTFLMQRTIVSTECHCNDND